MGMRNVGTNLLQQQAIYSYGHKGYMYLMPMLPRVIIAIDKNTGC